MFSGAAFFDGIVLAGKSVDAGSIRRNNWIIDNNYLLYVRAKCNNDVGTDRSFLDELFLILLQKQKRFNFVLVFDVLLLFLFF